MNKRILLGSMAILVAIGCYWLNPTPASGQSGTFRILSSFYVEAGGVIYHLEVANAPIGWRALPYASFTAPPVPASSIVAMESGTAITDSGEGWIDMGVGGWQSVGQVPGTVSTIKSSWGAVKARYR